MGTRVRVLLFGLLLACSPTSTPSADSSAAIITDTQIEDIETWESPAEHIESANGLADFMFELTDIHTVEITLSDANYSALAANPYTYVSADIRYRDTVVTNVGVRIKGRLGSYRHLSAKPALKVNIDAFVEDQSLFGLEELNLNNMVQDNAQIHDMLSYALYNSVGVAAPRTGYIWLILNGVDYGLYLNVESYTDPFLRRNFEDPDGTLYDGDYYMETWGSYTTLDFYDSHIPYFELDEGEDNGKEDLYALAERISHYAGTAQFDEKVGELVNLDLFTRFWAAEMWLGQYDGYNYNTNNYRVYFDPADDGRAMLMPWDHDWSFYSGTPITSPSGLLSYYCRWDEVCYGRFLEAVAEVCDSAETGHLEALLDRAIVLINESVAADPKKETSYDNIVYYQEVTRSWIQSRGDSIRSTWGLPTD
jgi:spore coat protein CotH